MLPDYFLLLPQRYYVLTDVKIESTYCFHLVRTTGTKTGVFHPHPDSTPPVTHTHTHAHKVAQTECLISPQLLFPHLAALGCAYTKLFTEF